MVLLPVEYGFLFNYLLFFVTRILQTNTLTVVIVNMCFANFKLPMDAQVFCLCIKLHS